MDDTRWGRLEAVRRELEALAKVRRVRGLSEAERDRYLALGTEEQALLEATAIRTPSSASPHPSPTSGEGEMPVPSGAPRRFPFTRPLLRRRSS